MGGWGYFESGSPTSLIPVVIGVLLVLLNKGIKTENKVVAHIAVLVTLLGFALVMPLMRAMEDGRTEAILRILIMLSSTVYAMIFFVKSFIDARKK
jgi:positive regulator of sigma E activity